ncbi:MAG: CehA/McbA family metallohydrolase [Myxococcales bacterium]|nr:CehA/McbA family metallohydrolase [Myxococcales bacterium]
MIRTLRASLALIALLAPASAYGAEQRLVLSGNAPEGGPDHFFVPFEVPAGTKEIEIVHKSLVQGNTLDFGLNDPAGYRGWGGGTSENAVVGEGAASRAYVPGPITPGTWRVVVGKAALAASPAAYQLEVVLRDAPTLPAQTNRAKYTESPALVKARRWYAGDLHAHSQESTDASPPLEDLAAFAKSRGLDFVEVSDHNTITQLDFFAGVQAKHPDLLLVPGVEYTTYAGHANAIGATRWVDHKVGQPGVTADGAARAFAEQGAVFSINHPVLDLGALCIGCAWKQPIDEGVVGGVEIATIGLKQGGSFFSNAAIDFWDKRCAAGRHLAALGGSDDHSAGKKQGERFASPIGDPTTMVLADELSVKALVDAIKKGRTVVKLQGPGDPMVEVASGDAVIGDTVRGKSALLKATVTGGRGAQVRFVVDGEADDVTEVTGDPFTIERAVTMTAGAERRVRAEVLVEASRRTVTSHVWLAYDPAGPDPVRDRAADDGGCNGSGRSPALVFAPIAAALLARRLTRRRATARSPSGG